MSRVVSSAVFAQLQRQDSARMRGYVIHTVTLMCGHSAFKIAPPEAQFKFIYCRECGETKKPRQEG